MNVYLNGKIIQLKPSQSIGKGGEADVFRLGKNKAIKVFKQPDHPDYSGIPQAQQAARDRLREHQQKLRQFPPNLPRQVISPEDLVTNRAGDRIVGYTMPLVSGAVPLMRYRDRAFRNTSGIDNNTITKIFQNLHQTVSQIHATHTILGDFNDLNILISQDRAYLIDADSYQFKHFSCHVFTTRFVDPLLCDPTINQLSLTQKYNQNSDWYAFNVMLMQSFLFVDPYGGVYKPKDSSANIPHPARPLKRITVFNQEVKYPKPAIPYQVLSDDLLHYFYRCFQEDLREPFPLQLLDNLTWTQCASCGVEYSRSTCPHCSTTKTTPLTPPQAKVVRGRVTVASIFQTSGMILAATFQEGNLYWLYHEQGTFRREDNTVILTGNLTAKIQFWLQKKVTHVGIQGQVTTLNPDPAQNHPLAVDTYHDQPAFNCNVNSRYWLYNGQLLKDGKLGQEYIGNILIGQTQFWVGSHFGFGFYHAEKLKVAFVFSTTQPGINDQVKLPQWRGKLVTATCSFSANLCWFFAATEEQGKLIHSVCVIRASGEVIAAERFEATADSWLISLGSKCAVNNFLFAATDTGMIRLEVKHGKIIKTKEFPDTEPFVDSSCQLLASAAGVYVIKQREILKLQIT